MTKSQDYQRLKEYIQNMKMEHYYQPVMLKTILQKGGRASITEIAQAIAYHDEALVKFFEDKIKDAPKRTLVDRHKILKKEEKDFLYPPFASLTEEEVDDLIQLCNDRLGGFLDKHSQKVFLLTPNASGDIPAPIRFRVLKYAKQRCELCGREGKLHVDHITPRSKGGSDDISNLQALCEECNVVKRHTDDEDFRSIAQTYNHRMQGCQFCQFDKERIIFEHELCYAIHDDRKATEHHAIICPKRHVSDYFDLYKPEINAMLMLTREVRNAIEAKDKRVDEFIIKIVSGSKIWKGDFHCHTRIIPKRYDEG